MTSRMQIDPEGRGSIIILYKISTIVKYKNMTNKIPWEKSVC